jgi:class 3 adenylate cyclase
MCGSSISSPRVPREARKNVAVLFIDVVGSTTLAERLDPEPWRQIIDRYYSVAASAITAHGGEVEKFVGDAVMAVFGAAVSHEDDALRAVRAALETVAEISNLSAGLAASHKITLEVRCGICSGEVIAITDGPRDFRVVGDAVNTAARLQTAAQPGEILIDATSASMVRTTIGLDRMPPLALRGKGQPVAAWRVTGGEPSGDGHAATSSARLIGRQDELTELRSAFRTATKNRQLGLITLLGAAGIGKSRLVREFVGSYQRRDVTVLTGRCSAYGRGITYKPLAEMLADLDGGWAEYARYLESNGGEASRAAECLSGIVFDNQSADELAGVEEIAWAVRFLMSQLAQTKPVIMVWEDLHWASSTLLDMIDDLVTWLTDVPVLLVCLARTDPAEGRSSWAGGGSRGTVLEIGPLSYEQSAELVAEIAMREEVYAHHQDVLCERVARQCEGNPLFAELMLDFFADTSPGARLPPTISALMAARFDQLPQPERQLLEVAATIGRDFSWSALSALLAADDLDDSVAREMVAQLGNRRIISWLNPDSLRFCQALMRDTAYSLAPKTRRERLHLLLADWLAHRAVGESSQDDSMALAFHVEAANLLANQLRPGDTELPALASRAADILIGEGQKALHRNDLPGAVSLLERARTLVPATDERQVPLMIHISDCWYGRSDPERALGTVAAAAESAPADPRRALVCAIQRSILELRLGLKTRGEIADRAHQFAADLRSQDRNDWAAARLHQLEAHLHLDVERSAKAEAEFRLALDCARTLNDSFEEGKLLVAICELAQWSPTDVGAGLALCAEMSERFATNRVLLVPVLLTQARLAALLGDLNVARAALAAARAHTSDLHLDVADAVIPGVTGLVDSLAGEHRSAEVSYRRTQGMLIEMGRSQEATVYEAYAAREVFAQGKVREAGVALARLMNGTAALDLRSQIVADALSARVTAATGRANQVVDLAAGAAKMSEQTDDLCLQGDCYADLAIVAAQAGQQAAAAEAAFTALSRYQTRGATRLAERAERLLAAVGDHRVPKRSGH